MCDYGDYQDLRNEGAVAVGDQDFFLACFHRGRRSFRQQLKWHTRLLRLGYRKMNKRVLRVEPARSLSIRVKCEKRELGSCHQIGFLGGFAIRQHSLSTQRH